jgi:hypothetical protein
VLVAQGKLDEALKAYRDGLAIAERLAAADRNNTEWQRDLSIAYEKVGDVLVAQGKVEAPISGQGAPEAAPIYGIKIPAGYRDWRLIAVAHEEGNLNDLLAQLGNDVAIQAFREGKLPFPDGAALELRLVRGKQQSFRPRPICQGLKKYAGTGGWGFADFTAGKPADEAVHKTCFHCHEPAKARDFVYTRYAP